MQTINVGTLPNDHTGDPLRDAFIKVNNNFLELNSKTTYIIWGYVNDYASLPTGITSVDPQIGHVVGVNTDTGTSFFGIGNKRYKGFYKRSAMTGVIAADYGTTPYAGFPIQANQVVVDAGADDTSYITPLTYSTNLTTGISGGRTITGGTDVTDALTLKGTSGNGTLTSPAINLKVGNNGGTNAITVLNNGNVGFGETNLDQKLNIAGSVATNVFLGSKITETNTGGRLYTGIVNGRAYYLAGLFVTTPSLTSYLIGSTGSETYFNAVSTSLRFQVTNSDKMIILSNGNIGINTQTPTKNLSFGGNTTRTIWLERHTTDNTAGNSLTTQAGGATVGATDKLGGTQIFSNGIGTGNASGTAFEFKTYNPTTSGTTDQTATTKMSIMSDGKTNIGDIVGANYSSFESDGTLVFNGTATTWRDEIGDAISLQQTGSGISRNATESCVEYVTTSNTSDYLFCNVQLNHDRKSSSVIYPHIHWWQTENNIPNFLLQYRTQLEGGSKTTGWTNLQCTTNAHTYVSGTLNQISYSTGITVVGSVSDIIQFRIIRDNGNTTGIFTGTDTFTTTVQITAFDVHIECDMTGSRTQYTK